MRCCSLCPKKMCLVSKKEDASWSTVQSSIWQKGQEGTKRSNSGRKEKWTDEVVKSLVKEIPWEKRTSIRETCRGNLIYILIGKEVKVRKIII